MTKTKEQIVKPPVGFGDYLICNHDKLNRVINGTVGSKGGLVGGLGKDASPEAILAEYDKLGGLIRNKAGENIAMGSFYDFENKCARTDISLAKKPNEGGLKIAEEHIGDVVDKPKKKKK